MSGLELTVKENYIMDEKLYGKERYYDMWYELFKESLRGMNIGIGGGNRNKWGTVCFKRN